MTHNRPVSLHPGTTSADRFRNWRSYEIQISTDYLYPTSISAQGANHICARYIDSTIKCLGSNSFGQLGDGTGVEKLSPVNVSGISNAITVSAGSYHTCAMLSDKTVKCWEYNRHGQLSDGSTTDRTTPVSVSRISNASMISVGTSDSPESPRHSCSLLSNSTIQCWGEGKYVQFGNSGEGTYYVPTNTGF